MLQRIAFTFLGLSGSIFLIAFAMEESSAAGNWNPAWQIILPLKIFFMCLWGAILVAAVIFGFIVALFHAHSALRERKEKLLTEALQKERQIQAELSHVKLLEEEAQRENAIRLKREAEDNALREVQRRSLEEKQNRSSEAAAKAALDEFR
jgi:uncharacterized membrane protein